MRLFKLKSLAIASAVATLGMSSIGLPAYAQIAPHTTVTTEQVNVTPAVITSETAIKRLNEKSIENPNLAREAPVAKVQAARAIQSFMNDGTRDCKTGEKDKNGIKTSKGDSCTGAPSLITENGELNYGYTQQKANKALGTQTLTSTGDTSGHTISAQIGQLAILCSAQNGLVKDSAFLKPQVIAGVAIKPLECSVDALGNATFSFQACTGPAFGKPIVNPPNAVTCSENPTDANFKPPAGYVCALAACDTEPLGSQYGWSPVETVTYAKNSTEESNGRSMMFYPALGSGITPSYTADSETLTVIKVVDTYYNAAKTEEAIGIKIALRYRLKVNQDQLRGEESIGDPSTYTPQWRSVEALNGNARLQEETTRMGAPAASCISRVVDGVDDPSGEVRVCDESHVAPDGTKPMAVSAQVVADAAQCTSTSQCISEIVTTTTWTETCLSATSKAVKDCKVTTTWQLYQQEFSQTRQSASCTESRSTYTPTCSVTASTPYCWLITIDPAPYKYTIPKGNVCTGGFVDYTATHCAGYSGCLYAAKADSDIAVCEATYIKEMVVTIDPPPYQVQSCNAVPVTNGCTTYDNSIR